MTTNKETSAPKKRRGNLGIIDQAIEINGYLPVEGPHGTYRIKGISGIATNGAWITTHLTQSMMGYVRIKKSAQKWITQEARSIIARRETIEAEQAEQARIAALQLR